MALAPIAGWMAFGLLLTAARTEGGPPMSVYVGTYTSGESRGIYRLSFDPKDGVLSPAGEAAVVTPNPSFVALHPKGHVLYAVNETGETRDDRTGTVSAFGIEAGAGPLTLLGRQPSGGAAPCHLWVTSDGRHLLVANYASGTVALLPLDERGVPGAPLTVVEHEGRGRDPRRQEGPHAHFVRLDPDEAHVLAVDLGIDAVVSYRLDAARGTLVRHGATRVADGAGPRHLAFDPGGRRVYVANELDSTVSVFDYDADSGTLTARQTASTLPLGWTGRNFPAEVAVHPSGRFVYVSNRGHDSIAIFSVDPHTGGLTAGGHEPTRGTWPRNFVLDPAGAHLLVANERSDDVAVFRIDPDTGALLPRGEPVRVPRPTCLRFAP